MLPPLTLIHIIVCLCSLYSSSASKGVKAAADLVLFMVNLLCASQSESSPRSSGQASTSGSNQSIARMTTAEWRARYEKDGMVDLWLEDDFNAGVVVSVQLAPTPQQHSYKEQSTTKCPAYLPAVAYCTDGCARGYCDFCVLCA